jgi:Fic family protein
MSRNRDERGQFTEPVSLSDVLDVFESVDGPVITSGDVASVTGCSNDSARRTLAQLHDRGRVDSRKTAGRVVYWRLDTADPSPVDPADPIFTDRPSLVG